jgi:glucokinase
MNHAPAASEPGGERPSPSGDGGARVLIGADVGATTIAVGLVTEAGEILAFERVATHGRGRGTALPVLLESIEALRRAAGRHGWSVGAIGIGLPGIVDAERGTMVSSRNYVPEFAGVPLASDLRASTDLPVFVDNDANALALGELEFGVGRGASSMALVAIGTGVGGAIILDGRLVRGHSHCAGEFGHVSIDFQGQRSECPCGSRGCLNSYIAGEALARAGREAVRRGESSKLLGLAAGDPERIHAALVFEAAAVGDEAARAIVERACAALGAAIAGIVNTLDPELVVVTGGVAASLVPLERSVLESARQYALPRAFAATQVRIVPADKRRTALGGAALALAGLRREGRPIEAGSRLGTGRDTTGRR